MFPRLPAPDHRPHGTPWGRVPRQWDVISAWPSLEVGWPQSMATVYYERSTNDSPYCLPQPPLRDNALIRYLLGSISTELL